MAQRNGLAATEDLARVRRPQNAFILYSNDNRRRFSTLNPHLDNRAISRMLGRNWREMRTDQQYSYRRRALEVSRNHRETHPDYYYNPMAARRRRSELRQQRLMRRENAILENPNQTVIETQSRTTEVRAQDEPPNRMFQPLIKKSSSFASLQTPNSDHQINGSSALQFIDILTLLQNNIQINDLPIHCVRTTCTPKERVRNENEVQNVMTGSDGALTNTSLNPVIDTRSQSIAQSVDGFFHRS